MRADRMKNVLPPLPGFRLSVAPMMERIN